MLLLLLLLLLLVLLLTLQRQQRCTTSRVQGGGDVSRQRVAVPVRLLRGVQRRVLQGVKLGVNEGVQVSKALRSPFPKHADGCNPVHCEWEEQREHGGCCRRRE
jgi:hypothetical protein